MGQWSRAAVPYSLLLSLLFVSVASPQSRSAETAADKPLEYCSVTLSLARPIGTCRVAPVLALGPPRIASIPLTRVDNPDMAAFSISVDLRTEGTGVFHVGSFGPYPADRGERFALGVQKAFEKLRQVRGAEEKAQIVFEMKIPRTQRKPDRLSVEIGPVRWLYQEPR